LNPKPQQVHQSIKRLGS